MKNLSKICIFILMTNFAFGQWELRSLTNNINCQSGSNNQLYLGRYNGLTVYDFNSKNQTLQTTINSDLPGNYINSFLTLPDNTILISTNMGLAVIDNGVITINKQICKDYPDKDARNLYRDSDGNIWTFSAHNVNRYSNGIWKSFDLSVPVNSRFNWTGYPFEIVRLFLHKNQAWALFEDNRYTQTKYYFNNAIDDMLFIGIIADTGIVKVMITTDDFPYQQGGYNLANLNDDVVLQNADSVYFYHNGKWASTNKFSNETGYVPNNYTGFTPDNQGNIWYILVNSSAGTSYPASYNINSGTITKYLTNNTEKIINNLCVFSDGTIMAYNHQSYYIYDGSSWTKKSFSDFGIGSTDYFGHPWKINGKIYVCITYSFGNLIPGTIYSLDDGSKIPVPDSKFPYYDIKQFGVNKNGKGIFKGTFSTEPFQYEADSAFTKISGNSLQIVTSNDGNVYFNTSGSIYLNTWNGNSLNSIDMGFSDKNNAQIYSTEVNGDNLISLGQYEYATDSLNSFLSIYNFKTKMLLKYDKSNSIMPDFYYVHEDIMRFTADTVPVCIASDNSMNVWILTTYSLIKLNYGQGTYIETPKISYPNMYTHNIAYDSEANELLFGAIYDDYENNGKMFYIYKIDSNQWDSIKIADAGFTGNYIVIKKLLDNRIWASDDRGYLYKYSGNGKFSVYNLNANGKRNIGSAINDFAIDANNYLQLGTDFGLLTNKSILTDVVEKPVQNSEINIQPNPAEDYIEIKLLDDSQASETMNIEIYDVIGELVLTHPMNGSHRISIETLSPGLYFVKYNNKTYKFVKI